MWQRNFGIALIVFAGLVYYQAMPRQFCWQPTVFAVPMSAAPATIRFTAGEDSLYCPAVSHRYTLASGRDTADTGWFATPTLTSVLTEGTRRVVWRGTPWVQYRSDGRTYLLGSFPVEKNHTYTLSVSAAQGKLPPQECQPHLQVQRDPFRHRRETQQAMNAAFLCVFGSLFGLLFTFRGRSPLHLRGRYFLM